ncbi:hypothetical protein Gogos_021282 [Gossypium gossypioides]|uniref:Uncharacterized protein n=1 Tax=Gossypium gossypioides TaxID=34282 RepID=A0A7J9D6W6_GOSGO|nr:hypothetical protein [Gossypium gossypioides]
MEGFMDDSKHGTEYDQYVPTTVDLNRVKVSVQDPRFLKKLEEIRIKWGQPLRKVPYNIAELIEKICDLDICLRRRDEEVRRQ